MTAAAQPAGQLQMLMHLTGNEVGEFPEKNILIVIDPAFQYPLFAGLVGSLLLLPCGWPTWSGEPRGLGTPWAGHGPGMGNATFVITYARPGTSQSEDTCKKCMA